MSELSVLAYAEDLQRLTPEQLDAACVEARKTTEFMPVSAVILEASRKLQRKQQERVFLGPGRPKYLDEPKLSKEERDAALKDTEALRKKMRADLHIMTDAEIEQRRQLLKRQADEILRRPA